MAFPFDGQEHRLIVGDSYHGSLQYHSVKYDFKPPSIDFDKEGILECDGTKCKIRFPNKQHEQQTDAKTKRSTVYEGNIETKAEKVAKECILIVDRRTGTITLERVTSKMSVKNARGKVDEEVTFKQRRKLDRPAVSEVKTEKHKKKSLPPPVKKPKYEIPPTARVKIEPKSEPPPADDLILPSFGGGIEKTTNIIGLGGGDVSIKSEPKEETKSKSLGAGLFSPNSDDGNSDSSSSSSNSNSDDNSDSSDNNQSESENDSSDDQSPNPAKNGLENLEDQLKLSDSSESDDSD